MLERECEGAGDQEMRESTDVVEGELISVVLRQEMRERAL
jgi:hypothetical protein